MILDLPVFTEYSILKQMRFPVGWHVLQGPIEVVFLSILSTLPPGEGL